VYLVQQQLRRLDIPGADRGGAPAEPGVPAGHNVGPDHEAPIREHRRNATIPQSGQSAAGTYASVGHHVRHHDLRPHSRQEIRNHLRVYQGRAPLDPGKSPLPYRSKVRVIIEDNKIKSLHSLISAI
jgi:hypothetical protein